MLNKFISKFVITNEKTHKPSYTLTAFIFGIFIVNVKLILSGVTIGEFKGQVFTGVEYAACMAALGSVYSLNKHISLSNDKDTK